MGCLCQLQLVRFGEVLGRQVHQDFEGGLPAGADGPFDAPIVPWNNTRSQKFGQILKCTKFMLQLMPVHSCRFGPGEVNAAKDDWLGDGWEAPHGGDPH